MLEDSNFLDISKNNATRSLSNLSNLERNCNQIFAKGPAITKEFFDKIQHDVVPQKTDLFGYQMNTRRLILLTGLILLFTFSTMGTITMWFTNSYQNYIYMKMAISEESPAYNLWKAPSARVYFKIHIFNYTNVNDFEEGRAKKLHVEELGPYVYLEQLERVNIQFNKVNGTVSYQENRTYVFSEELSKGSKNDLVNVPNVPALSAASLAKHFNFLLRVSLSSVLKTLSQGPFITTTADKFIIGYQDNFFELAKGFLKLQDKRVFEDFGILAWKKGIQPDVFTVNTGTQNINELGQIESFNDQTSVNFWGSESCNNIRSSDGLIYPRQQVQSKTNLTFFVPQMCRKINMQYDKEMTILDRVPVYRYKIPKSFYDSAQDNGCYCNIQNGVCPPRGVFNSTGCSFGAPIFYSWPHFYDADPVFKSTISGLQDNPKLDEPFVYVHSKYGFLLGGNATLQANIQLRKSFGISQLNAYPDNLMLPVVWIETGLDTKDLPSDIVDMVYQLTFSVRNLELGIKYGCLLTTMVTLICILLVLKIHRDSRRRADSLRRPMNLDH